MAVMLKSCDRDFSFIVEHKLFYFWQMHLAHKAFEITKKVLNYLLFRILSGTT